MRKLLFTCYRVLHSYSLVFLFRRWNNNRTKKRTKDQSSSLNSSPTPSRSSTPDIPSSRKLATPRQPLYQPSPSAPSAPYLTDDFLNCQADAVMTESAMALANLQDGIVIPSQVRKNVLSIAKRLAEYDAARAPPPLPPVQGYRPMSPPNSPSIGITKGVGKQLGLDENAVLSELKNYYSKSP